MLVSLFTPLVVQEQVQRLKHVGRSPCSFVPQGYQQTDHQLQYSIHNTEIQYNIYSIYTVSTDRLVRQQLLKSFQSCRIKLFPSLSSITSYLCTITMYLSIISMYSHFLYCVCLWCICFICCFAVYDVYVVLYFCVVYVVVQLVCVMSVLYAVSWGHTATHCNTLQHTNTPQHTATHCNTQHTPTLCCMLYHEEDQHPQHPQEFLHPSLALCFIVLYCSVLHYTYEYTYINIDTLVLL